ncbi:MAG: hypothetical protein LBQ91_04400 [Oscillospiraceae bacterium]|jgi:hypothetical protein|nr:hypothetical protein [Oscillospiraceae bacterium]
MNKTAKIISGCVYGIGAAIVVSLAGVALFGSNQAINTDAMLSVTWREQAFMILAFGTIPMILASMALYKFNDVKNSAHKIRNAVCIFLPAAACAGCALFIIGLLAVGYVRQLFFS